MLEAAKLIGAGGSEVNELAVLVVESESELPKGNSIPLEE